MIKAGLVLMVGVLTPTASTGTAPAILTMGRCLCALLRNQNNLIVDHWFSAFAGGYGGTGLVPSVRRGWVFDHWYFDRKIFYFSRFRWSATFRVTLGNDKAAVRVRNTDYPLLRLAASASHFVFA
jgi:hypothetical protein